MAGIRQTAAFEYASSDKVQVEFENLVRYLQQAEIGGKTLGEIIENLTDDQGNLNSNVEFQLDSSAGLQYRVGETGAFTTIAALSELRGEAGQNVGDIGAPIFNGRQDYIVGTTLRQRWRSLPQRHDRLGVQSHRRRHHCGVPKWPAPSRRW